MFSPISPQSKVFYLSSIYLSLTSQTSLPQISICFSQQSHQINLSKILLYRASLILKLVLISCCLCDKVQTTKPSIQSPPKATPTHLSSLLLIVRLSGSEQSLYSLFLSGPFINSHCPVHYSCSLGLASPTFSLPFEVPLRCYLFQEAFPVN